MTTIQLLWSLPLHFPEKLPGPLVCMAPPPRHTCDNNAGQRLLRAKDVQVP